MLELDFRTFVKRLDESHKFTYPTIHSIENALEFKLLFKNWEKWEYFTVIPKETVIAFGAQEGISAEDSLSDFRLEYFTHTVPVKESSIDFNSLNEQLELKQDESETESDEEEDDDEKRETVSKPKKVDECVAALMADTGFKPQSGQTKEQAAFAVCNAKQKLFSILKSNDDEVIEAGEPVEESVDYATFLRRVINGMEKKVVKALSKLDDEIQKGFKDQIIKTFGEFLEALGNSVNTLPFLKTIRQIVKRDFQTGVESAEAESNIQIGFTEDMGKQVNILSQEQIVGYRTNIGKQWNGIRGATEETRFKIIKAVERGLGEGKNSKEISKDVRHVFDVTRSRGDAIARTETTRILNDGKLSGYKEAGIPRKAYSAVMDNSTAPICKRLHRKYFNNPIPINDLFHDDETGIAESGPPTHPNCRCVIEAREEGDFDSTGGEWKPEPI